jgi:hypothetical protein
MNATATRRTICGTRYTQAEARDERADFAEALRRYPADDYAALMYLHSLGYDCSTARVVR